MNDHPRPQLVRDSCTPLDGPWDFAVDSGDLGLQARWYQDRSAFTRTIVIPFPPESPASGIGEIILSPVWYRREFHHEPRHGERLLLHFEAVDYRASVWVNGTFVGDHEGGQSRFTFDVTDAARSGTNELVVRVVDDLDLEQPRGKQDWRPEPHVIWYRRTSGVWRSVWLETVPDARIDRLVLTPQPDLTSLRLEARIVGTVSPSTTLEVEVTLDGTVLARIAVGCTSRVARAVIVLDHASLDAEPEDFWWTPERPTLLDVTARLAHDGLPVDTVHSYVGLRTVGTDATHVLLNERPYFLRLVLEQGYWPETYLASPSAEALEREVLLIKELGFNGIRMHQTSADPRFLECCDRLGLLVIADIAAAYRFSDVALARTAAELTALVQRDANHPCVVGWVPFNESWGVPHLAADPAHRYAVEAMYALVKALDPSRLALGNDGWEYAAGDVVGVHDYVQDGLSLQERYGTEAAVRRTLLRERPGGRALLLPGTEAKAAARPVVLTEFGGLSAHDDATAWQAYGDILEPDELPARLTALVTPLRESSGLAGFCYTQLTDTAQEKNGLLTEQREPKCPPERIRAAVTGR